MTTRKTSLQWWEETLADETKLIAWLKDQYHGEATAAERIVGFAEQFAKTHEQSEHYATLLEIASQEKTHAGWVAELLITRGLTPAILDKQTRYWDKTLPGIESFETGAAVGAHAERMRLERIRVIATHPRTPLDIRAVFLRILPQEEYHDQAFSLMAGDVALATTANAHEIGREALGLAA